MAEALTKAGRYQIVGELGRGSMGVVYQGFDPVIGRTVAIKTMLPQGLSPQEFQEYKTRFQREAMAAGILAHPNIITVYDFGEDNGVLYLAMEFLEGKSLEKIAQEQTVLPIETILPIYDQVCSALDHAHRNKIVHRDIKPANIMILQNGLVKVTDFGIAKMMAMGMTQAGQILGTPNYMSPEQVKGRQIDGRSDIFSLGVILYELMTGEKPFGGQNITTVIYKIINENPTPPRELDASIPAGLSYVISKALAKNIDERYQTCRELAEDLRNYKNLGGTATGQGTVVLNVPPVPMEAAELPPPPPAQTLPLRAPASPPAPPAVDEAPSASSINIQMIPPPPARPQSIPQITWVLGALLVVAIMGSISYFLVLRPRSQPVATVVTAPVARVNPVQNPQPPVAPAANNCSAPCR
jgi:serine/threonine-protein kinase